MLLSVIIPTRNRQKYCFVAVQSILKTLTGSFEVIVHDNSDTKELEFLLDTIDDKKLKYFYSSNPYSFVENFNISLSKSKGEYFCFLGDDDAVLPYIMDIAIWMCNNEIESLCSSSIPDYTWLNETLGSNRSGLLILPSYCCDFKFLDVREKLTNLVQNGILTYQKYNLPRTYHGLVKRSCMEEVKKITGNYFGGLTPDIYSTIALSCIVTKHVVVGFPITLAGACPKSASVANMSGKHSGGLKNAPHFKNRGEYKWESVIPYYYSVETIWAETALKALREMGENSLIKTFNSSLFIISAILANRYYIMKLALGKSFIISSSVWKNFFHSTKLIMASTSILPRRILHSLKRRFFVQKNDMQNLIFENVPNLQTAVDIILDEMKSRFSDFKRNLNRYEKD